MRSGFFWLSVSFSVVGFTVGVSGCASAVVYPHRALNEQVLWYRPNHPGKLTNQGCAEYKGEECIRESILKYDLADAAFRRDVDDLKFICRIGEQIFRVCKDRPGFCRQKPGGIFSEEKQDYIDAAARPDFLERARAHCFNPFIYGGGILP